MPTLARRAIAEMLGTAFLVFFGCGVIVADFFPGAGYHVFGIAMVHAIILSIAISVTMDVSGGQLNPAVTLGLLAIRKIDGRDAFVYILSQLVGALVAAFLVRSFLAPNVGHVVAYGTPTLNSTITLGNGIVLEAIFGFLLMSGVLGTIVARNAPRIAGFGVGLTLIPIIMVGGPLTGGVANPARAIGPAVISGTSTALAVWIIGPIVGAVLAALLFQYGIWGKEEIAG
ncbi:MAG TPA: aquaporin [Gemmatimonadales bacterium]|jgi:MIP family channel proteins